MIEGRTGPWETVIGLEVHAQVVSKAKLFSGAATDFGAEPNTQVSPVDAAFPGMLPVINRHCVEQAVRTGLGLDAEINLTSVFERKNYFYPDLPAGYQISQYQQPLVGHGRVTLDMPDGSTREVDITRLHLEQDAGKSLHDQHPSLTYVDLNRAGVALMEIVSEPDLRSAEEAGIYLRKLRSILRYLGTCDGNMEEGSLRCDCNVSVRRPHATARHALRDQEPELGPLCDAGDRLRSAPPDRYSRRWRQDRAGDAVIRPGPRGHPADALKGRGARLPLLPGPRSAAAGPRPRLGRADSAPGCRNCPTSRRRGSCRSMVSRPEDAGVLVAERATALFFERVAAGRDPKTAANWVMGDLFGALNRLGLGIERSPISAEQLGALIDLIADGTISGRLAKEVFAEMIASGADPAAIVEAKGLRQVTDEGAIAAAIDAVLAAHADKVSEYRAGRDKLYGFFVGQVMRATQGKANPALVNELLKKKLASLSVR